MKKSDLKSGMIVKIRKGCWCIVLNNSIVSISTTGGGVSFDDFSDNLTSRLYSNDWDIVEVYDVPQLGGAGLSWWVKNDFTGGNGNSRLKAIYPVVETIEIAGKKFNKNDVEDALKDLKPID